MNTDIRSLAGHLAAIRHRKTRESFARRVAADAAKHGIAEEALWEAIRFAGQKREEKRSAERRADEREAARMNEAFGRLPALLADLEAAGWTLDHASESGSRYYAREGETLRISDHLVPVSAERDMAAADRGFQDRWTHEILIGKRGWERKLQELS